MEQQEQNERINIQKKKLSDACCVLFYLTLRFYVYNEQGKTISLGSSRYC
jgi:hypothetical protein